jgi:hypothetical protein
MTEKDSYFIEEASRKIASQGQFGRGDVGEDAMRDADREAVAFRLIELFNARVYPFPWQFSDEEIDIIGGWPGDDEQGTFFSTDEPLIDAYNLDVTSSENTFPKFAAILRARKAAWRAEHPDADKKRGFRHLEAAVQECLQAGIAGEAIEGRVMSLCDEHQAQTTPA